MKIDELINSLQRIRNYVGSDSRLLTYSDAKIMIENGCEQYDDIEEIGYDEKAGKYYIRIKDPTIIKAPK